MAGSHTYGFLWQIFMVKTLISLIFNRRIAMYVKWLRLKKKIDAINTRSDDESVKRLSSFCF